MVVEMFMRVGAAAFVVRMDFPAAVRRRLPLPAERKPNSMNTTRMIAIPLNVHPPNAHSIGKPPVRTRMTCSVSAHNRNVYLSRYCRHRARRQRASFTNLIGSPPEGAYAIARNPFAFTRLSSLSDGPSGRFAPRSHLLTASFRTFR
jgi:hypothetical protein